MNRRLIIISLILIWLMSPSCYKDEFDMKNPDVGQFLSFLKSDIYFEKAGYYLPEFKNKHFECLLFSLKETTFPPNPFPSKYTDRNRLNDWWFWTIDGNRFGNKYPPLEPCLIDTSTYTI